MAAVKKKPPEDSSFQELLKQPFTKLIGAITTIAAIFGLGYGIGVFKEGLDSKVDKMELKQDCSEKVQAAVNDCRETKIQEYEKAVNDVKSLVNDLKKGAK